MLHTLSGDDIIILSCTIHGLQQMLNTCYEIAANLKSVFNCYKSKCITFGPGCKLDIRGGAPIGARGGYDPHFSRQRGTGRT